MVYLLTTLFLSAVVQLSAGVVSPWHRSMIPLVPSAPSNSGPAGSGPSAFKLQDNIVGKDFLSFFSWTTADDPTHGRVNYVDQETAVERGLAKGRRLHFCLQQSCNLKNMIIVNGNSFIMRADDTNVVPATARGRDSNRITSHKSYTDSIIVLDVQHVPFGCGTWPAFWTVDLHNWPSGGEIDIIECVLPLPLFALAFLTNICRGVNNVQANFATLHTENGCTMAQNRAQKGYER